MKTNYVPAIVMLLAGCVYCLFGIYYQVPLMEFSIQLLIVLLVFYILGGIIRMVLDRFIGEVVIKTDAKDEEASDQEASEDADGEAVIDEETSQEETASMGEEY